MKKTVSILLLTAPLLFAQENGGSAKKNPIGLLPDGSVLKGVLLPRYDEDLNLVGDVYAEKMTLISSDLMEGENVLIKFYNPDRTPKGQVEMDVAFLNQATQRLISYEPVTITNDRLIAKGSGMVYGMDLSEGFLSGPVKSWIKAPPKTSMNNNPLTAPSAAMALFAASFSPGLLTAAPPAYASEDELAAVKKAAESTMPELDSRHAIAKAELEQNLAEGQEASKATREFLKNSEVKEAAATAQNQRPPAKPLEVTPAPEDTIINCDGGMYFDSENSVVVYLKNVTVRDPKFNLDGADELKIFFGKRAAETEKGEEPKTETDFGDVRNMEATGAVRFLQKAVDGKKPVEASGRVLTYDFSQKVIIIHGGFPWVKQGAMFARAKQPELTLRIQEDGTFSTKGKWETGVPLDQEKQNQ
ncbi:MAG: hypothetical protein ACSHX7_08425 [Luteolibacter sp.]